MECFRTEFREFASILVTRNGIQSCVLFREMVRNRIMRVCFYFCFTERNSELFPLRGRVRNGIPRFSVPRNNRNSVGNNHLFRLFRLPRNYFFVGNSQPYVQYSKLRKFWCMVTLSLWHLKLSACREKPLSAKLVSLVGIFFFFS